MEAANIKEKVRVDAKSGALCSGGILIALYDTAIRYAQEGHSQIEKGDSTAAGITLGKMYSIIAELAASLDHARAPELCDNLEKIYSSMLESLIWVDARKDASRMLPVISGLKNLRDAWAQAIVMVASGEAPIPATA
jgi:flagellar biosynthetic protein FliS